MGRPTHLRVEHLDAPLGTTEPTPRLSWRLPLGSREQFGYQIEIDGVARPRVESPASVLVAWPGVPLGSRQEVEWRVKVWTDAGESDWSSCSTFETGLLEPTDWQASWIEPVEREHPEPGRRPAYVLRTEFSLDALGDARLYATAHGIYEAFLNGERVGDIELAPGFTSYHAHVHVQAYNVAGLLVPGANIWEVVLSDGWYRGKTGFTQSADMYGEHVAFLGQLHVGDAVIATGDDWRWSTGPVVAADLMSGEEVDFRRRTDEWHPVAVVNHGYDRLAASPAPPTRRVQELRPVAVTRPAPDRQVVDLGQNINGWARLTRLGPEGVTLTLTHGEALDASGDVTQEHLAGADMENMTPIPVGMIDRVTSAGREGEVFEPRHTTHGFQYVRVEGHPERLSPDDITGVVVHTDLRRTGWFRCSDARLNRLHDMTVWSFRDNACEVPTDCPQRERAGWTGDYQVFAPTAAFLFDVAGFSVKWLRDLVADARPDGCLGNFAPDPARPRAILGPEGLWHAMAGSAGWGDAITIVPWELWRSYGDERVLAECWQAMRAWIDFAAKAARTSRHPSRVARSAKPLPHEAFLWDGGFHWGEWHEPEQTDGPAEDQWTKDKGDIGTAFLHRSAQLAARIGRLLGADEEADRLDELAGNALAAWRAEFIAHDGTLAPATQANHVRALAFGLVPEDLRDVTAQRLVRLIREAGTHLGTGFLATPYLLPVLADAGHLDVAYELLFQDSPPSWLYMVDKGATTLWEAWHGIDAQGAPHASLNHYSKGAVISFLHTHTAGIQLLDDAPAYRRFRVAPHPGGGLTWAEAVHDSPYGRLESSWHVDGEAFRLTVTVPPGTSADVVLPDGARATAGPGTSTHTCKRN